MFLCILLLRNEVSACSCTGERAIKEEIENQDAVFVGFVKEAEQIRIYDTLSPNHIIDRVEMKYTMVIESVYKGSQMSDTVFIFTGIGGGDCGYNFKIGQKYIVYGRYLKTADRHNRRMFIDKKSAFYTTICSRTRKYQSEEIKEIKRYLKKSIK